MFSRSRVPSRGLWPFGVAGYIDIVFSCSCSLFSTQKMEGLMDEGVLKNDAGGGRSRCLALEAGGDHVEASWRRS